MNPASKPFMILIGAALAASCTPGLTETEMTATQQALSSPTPMVTITPTVTRTLPPTLTPTITLTPTSTTLPVVVEAQDDGSTHVRFFALGFQFVLPQGWNFRAADPESGRMGEVKFDFGDGTDITFWVWHLDTNQSAEYQRDRYLNLYDYDDDVDILRHGLTENQHHLQMAYLEVSGQYLAFDHYHEYSLFFEANEGVIRFIFFGNINAGRYPIGLIQASIEGLD